MVEKKVTIKNPSGLHMRPACNLCQKAMEYDCSIQIRFRNREFNAKSLLGVLSACVQPEDEISVVCSGIGEETALQEITAYMESGMEEA